MKKTILSFIFIFVFALNFLPAQTANNPALALITNNFSLGNNNFAPGQVTTAERDAIVHAGLRAPSAGNRQPWLITVIQNLDLARQILPQAAQGDLLIVVSGLGDGATNGPVILDCALAAQNMFLAAQALGLGARQFTNAPLINRANGLKAQLGIPADHNAIIVTRVGRMPAGVDAVSSASPRANPADKVVYR